MITQQIIDLEKQFWKAIQERDVDAALKLVSETCIVTGPQGFASISRAAFAEMMKNDKWELHKYEFLGDPAVLEVAPGCAVIAYKVREDVTVEGQRLTILAANSSTWVQTNGEWLCANHTESLIGDSFGRDRIARPGSDAKLPQQDAVANLAVKDLQKARKFYEETIGLKPVHTEGDEAIVYKSGNSTVNVYRSDFAGTNQATAVTWSVGNIESAVKDLKAKGVTFEHYDMPDTRLEGDVHVSEGMKVAWFKDPDGNILNLMSAPGGKP